MGRVFAVGVGPGSPDYVTEAVRKIIVGADVVVGYEYTLKTIFNLVQDKKIHMITMKDQEKTYQQIKKDLGDGVLVVPFTGDVNFSESEVVDRLIEIFGDGVQSRDFVHVSDVIQAFYCAIKNIEAKRGEVYNIGSGKSASINELASLLISSKGKDLQIIHKPERQGEVKFSKADISLAKTDINYSPEVSLRDGLASLV